MRTVLRDCLLPGGDRTDVALEGGLITAIGDCRSGGTSIDIKGHLLIPGAIDSHVHLRDFRQAYKEDWLSGTRAAASGGITTILEMPNTSPPTVDRESILSKCALAGKGIVNYGIHLGATAETCRILRREGIGVSERLPSLPDGLDRVKGSPPVSTDELPVASLKIFLGSTTGSLLIDSDELLEELFRCWSGLFTAHCEDEKSIQKNIRSIGTGEGQLHHESIRSREAALLAVARLLEIGERFGRRLHICHVTTKEEISLIRSARARGLTVSAEVTPHHLFLSRDDALKRGNLLKVNPPLREKEDCLSLREALMDGTVDCVASDHAPHLLEEKRKGYEETPAGLPGLETMLPLIITFALRERIPLGDVSRWLAEKPARIFGIRGRGSLEVGAAADLAVIDLRKRRAVKGEMLQTKARWSPFEDMELAGWPLLTLVNGRIACRREEI